MSAKKTVVSVAIGSDEYSLKSDRPAEYTRAAAAHVDRALKEVLATGAIVETHKAAILAALSITDELFQAQRAQRDMAEQLRTLAAELSRLLPPARRRT
ncbi:MAG: cell division protein ZapA [Armatimonadota bacterium]